MELDNEQQRIDKTHEFACAVADEIERLNPTYDVLMNGMAVLSAAYIIQFTAEVAGQLTHEAAMKTKENFVKGLDAILADKVEALLQIAAEHQGE